MNSLFKFMSPQFMYYFTFPGVIAHEIAHRIFCDIYKVPVYEVQYFQLGNPAGYVMHAHATDLKPAVLIPAGPFIINTILCALLCIPGSFAFTMLGVNEASAPIMYFLFWLGFSMGVHAFPSGQDIDNMQAAVSSDQSGSIVRLIARVCIPLFRLSLVLRYYWFDVVYAGAVALIIPKIILMFVG